MSSHAENGAHRISGVAPSLLAAAAAELQSARVIIRRVLVVTVALGFPIVYYGGSIPLLPFVVVGLVAGVSSLFTAISWFWKSRLEGLLLLPFSKRAVAGAVCIVGVLSAGVSDVVPTTLFFALAGTLSPTGVLLTLGFGVLTASFAFVCVSLLHDLSETIRRFWAPKHRLKSGLARTSPIVEIAATGRFSRLEHFIREQTTSNYLLAAILHDSRAWFSLIGLTIIGVVATDYLLTQGISLPVNAICVALTPPLTTLLSRDLDTRQQMLTLGTTRSMAKQYISALIITVIPLILLGDGVLALCGRPVSLAFVLASVVIYLAALAMIIMLEIRFPSWNGRRKTRCICILDGIFPCSPPC